MTGTRKVTAIALGICGLSISLLAVVFPGIAVAEVSQADPTPASVHAADEWPWNLPEATFPATASASDEWPWNLLENTSSTTASAADEWPWNG